MKRILAMISVLCVVLTFCLIGCQEKKEEQTVITMRLLLPADALTEEAQFTEIDEAMTKKANEYLEANEYAYRVQYETKKNADIRAM